MLYGLKQVCILAAVDVTDMRTLLSGKGWMFLSKKQCG